jgi:V/A-type H+-transporting ATPase subunit E
LAESIESFVQQLREEGVEAGRSEASQLVKQAEEQAAEIRAKAEADARNTVKKADQEAEQLVAKGKADLDLAVRDTMARLRQHLGAILSDILQKRSAESLRDAEVIKTAVAEIIRHHAEQAKAGTFNVQVSDELRDQVVEAAMSSVADAVDQGELKENLIQGGMSVPGFAYRVEGATVQVDAGSVSEHLLGMVSPVLRESIERQNAPKDEVGEESNEAVEAS